MAMRSKFGTMLLLGLVVMGSCKRGGEQRDTAPVKVKTEVAQFTNVVGSANYVGQVEAQSTTAASFTGMGAIEKICVSEGQRVQKGQLLAVMNSETSESALAAANAQLTRANDAYSRMKQLYDNGSLPEIKWVEIESNVAMAKSQVALAEKQMRDSRLLSPASGVIGRGIKQAGETAMPSLPVMNILDIDRVKVKVSVPEKEYARMKSSGGARIEVGALPGEIYASSKIVRGVEGNPVTHTYEVFLYVDNPNHRLLPGMVADVCFSTGDAESLLTLPLRAVHKSGTSNFVWIAEEGKAKIRPVAVGRIIGNRIAIDSGLIENDRVITEGHQKLNEGTKVSI